eukprot:scaffold97709_cov60-Phaeocystis_antarctica.AAC.2
MEIEQRAARAQQVQDHALRHRMDQRGAVWRGAAGVDRAHTPLPRLRYHRLRQRAHVQQRDAPRAMSGALHDGEALNAHERLQPVELLPHALGEARQALHCLEERRVTLPPVSRGRDDQQERVVGQRGQRQSLSRLRTRAHLLARSFAGAREVWGGNQRFKVFGLLLDLKAFLLLQTAVSVAGGRTHVLGRLRATHFPAAAFFLAFFLAFFFLAAISASFSSSARFLSICFCSLSLRATHMRSVASHDSSCSSIFSTSLILDVSCTSSAATPAAGPSRSARSFRSASRSSSISLSSSSLSGVSSSMKAAAPRGTVAQSTSSRGGSSVISLVRVRPLATPAPKTPSDSASKAPTLRAQRSLDGDMTTSAGRSISLSSKCEAKPLWQVASTHEKLSGPPALRLRSCVSISRCASLLPLSAEPSSSATAHSPPALLHAESKVAAESSGSGPSSFLGALGSAALGGSFGLPPPAAPISCIFISMNWLTKLARLPKLNLPCICGVKAMPCMAALPSSLFCVMSG